MAGGAWNRGLAALLPIGLALSAPAFAADPPASPAVATTPPATTPAATTPAATPPARRERPPRIPTADFAVRPQLTAPVLSPDGLHLAARFTVKGEERLAVADLTGKVLTQLLSIPKKTDLVRYFWAGNGTLIAVLGSTVPWFADEGYATRLFAFDVATGKSHVLDNRIMGLKGDDVLWSDPEGKTLLMAFQGSVYDFPAVYSMDVATNRAKRVSDDHGDIWDWYADSSGVVRYGFGYTGEHTWQMVYRSGPADKFKVVLKGNDDKDDDSVIDSVVRLSQGSDTGYTLARGADSPFWALYEYDFARHARGKLVYAAPGADVDLATVSDDGQKLISAQFTDDRNRIRWFDEKLATLQADLDKAVGADRQVWIASHSRNYETLVVALGGALDPGAYYLYQQAAGVMKRFSQSNDRLKASELAITNYVHYKARDGQVLAAYLTLPVGRPAKGLPLIIHPHGGPFGIRDEGDFDEEVQFYANRGYAVLQPQFRGSGSFGKAFEDAAKGQWGRAMQDDLDDGMDWLAAQGTIDAKRVCVIGTSYGGYAALWAATRNPERYRCAASFAGISDVPKWLKYSGRFEGTKHRENWRAQMQGDKTFDLKTVSPIYTVDRLKVPVLIAHGDADTRVPFKQSKQYADALTAAGKVHEFYTIADEGHGFTKADNEQLWLDKLDAFLAKYNPAD